MKNPQKLDTNCPKTATKPAEKDPKQYKTKHETIKKPDYRYNKRPFGRPSKYRPKYCKLIIEYFTREHTEEYTETHTNRKGETWSATKLRALPVPLLEGFAGHVCGCGMDAIYTWRSRFPNFNEACTRAQALQQDHLATVTGLGLYNSNWAVFMAKNISKWRDKKDIEHSGQVDSSIFVSKMVTKSAQAEADEHAISRLN